MSRRAAWRRHAQTLTRQTDLNACRNALQQINAELSEKPNLHPPALTNEQKDWLRENLGLSGEELSEVETNHYTRLDNHHLFRCFLMRDAASTLEVKGVRGKAGAVVREKPLDQAARAFAWVMREVRLRQRDGEEAPPAFVLRRGWGTALERALVFLALLEQLGDPDAPRPRTARFSAANSRQLRQPCVCGRAASWSATARRCICSIRYLGLPLPGPKGEGIATLSQVRQQPEVLAQLNVGDKYRYPVTMEQARAAQALLVCPLSTLSPRMRYLQEQISGAGGACPPGRRCRRGWGARQDRLLGWSRKADFRPDTEGQVYAFASISVGGRGRRGYHVAAASFHGGSGAVGGFAGRVFERTDVPADQRSGHPGAQHLRRLLYQRHDGSRFSPRSAAARPLSARRCRLWSANAIAGAINWSSGPTPWIWKEMPSNGWNKPPARMPGCCGPSCRKNASRPKDK